MKIQLVQPATGAYRSNSRSGSYAPLGLISIATHLTAERPDIDVELLDGEMMPHEDILSRVGADIVGINTNTVTYPQAVEVARAARRAGSRVVIGGVYASAVPELILRHRADIVDTVVVGYGERPMLDIANGNRERLLVNHASEFNSLRHPDRSLARLEEYIATYQRLHPTWRHRGTNIFTNVGCRWRDKSQGGCIFCSRSGIMSSFRDPALLWREIRELADRFGVDYVVDFSDTTLQNIDWLKEVIRAKPRGEMPRWHIFARIDELTQENIDLARQLPCDHIFVGMESGDPRQYIASRKGGGSPEQGLAAAALLARNRIQITPSYVIGLPGETPGSLQATLEHATRVSDITGFEEIFCCQLIPFPGSLAFDSLRRVMPVESDIMDIEDLKLAWAQRFCDVDFRTMAEYTERILALGRYPITISRGAHAGALPLVDESPESELYTCV